MTYAQEIMNNIREILQIYKKEYKLTNAEISKKCGLSISTYNKIMNDKYSKYGCSVNTLFKISRNLNIYPDNFFLGKK